MPFDRFKSGYEINQMAINNFLTGRNECIDVKEFSIRKYYNAKNQNVKKPQLF